MTTTESNLATNWEWQPLNSKINLSGSRGQRTVGNISFGVTGLQVKAKNSCGWSAWYPLNWELVEVPDPIQKVSGVNEGISVFPNPSNNSWNFSARNVKIENISITDILGKNVYQKNVSQNQVAIDCTSLNKGIYIAKVKTSDGSETFRLIKN